LVLALLSSIRLQEFRIIADLCMFVIFRKPAPIFKSPFTALCYVYTVPAHLFAKVPWPGDSKVTFAVFESSCQLLLPT